MHTESYPSYSLCVNPILRTAPTSILVALARAEGQAAEHDSRSFSKDKLAQLTLATLAGNEEASIKVSAFVKLISAYLSDTHPYPTSSKSICESARNFYESMQLAAAHPNPETGEMIASLSVYSLFEG